MSTPLAVLAAGGTGGHMFPAQALAEELLRRGWRVALASDERGMRYAGGFADAVERKELRSATPSRGGVTAKLSMPVAVFRGILAARSWMLSDRPAIVVGFGGYPAVPSMAAARLLGVPRIIHEQNGVLGLANRLFARGVDAVAVGMGRPVNMPKGVQVEDIGNPIRDSVRAVMTVPYATPAAGDLRLVVFGGSQGASVLSEVVPAAITHLPEELRARLRIVQQVRDIEVDPVSEVYRKANIAEPRLAPFFADMPALIAEAHLVIARAGASSCAEIAAIGRPAILVPLPTATADHQTANARFLERAGGALCANQDFLTPESLAANLEELLGDPDRLSGMAMCSQAVGKPNAASDLADLVERYISA